MGQYNRLLWLKVTADSDGAIGITVDTNAYTAGDNIGGRLKVIYGAESGCLIRRVKVLDLNAGTYGVDLRFYHTQPSAFTDDDAFAPTDADGQKEVGRVRVLSGDFDGQTAYATAYKYGSDVDIEIPTEGDGITVTDGTFYMSCEAIDANNYGGASNLEIYVGVWLN